MSLQQQIQREIDEEARIDKRIESMKKRILKQPGNRKYRILSTNNGADAALVFVSKNLTKYSIVLYEENNEILNGFENDSRFSMIFLKNKNPHDTKLTTYGYIKAMGP